eukprot:scaffold1651_cov317-Pinguiococcus_pyrenoidosus.AAC.12
MVLEVVARSISEANVLFVAGKLRACYSRLLKASHIRTMESLEVDNMQISSNVMKIVRFAADDRLDVWRSPDLYALKNGFRS